MRLAPLLLAVITLLPENAGAQDAVQILQTSCASCHGAAMMSGLDLRSREALAKGGSRGAVVVPGSRDRSLLYRAVAGSEPGLQMPPGKTRLSPEQIAAIGQWIDSGAAWNQQAPAAAPAQTWWSLKKPERPPVPAVADPHWRKNPVDAFVFVAMKAKDLRPAGAASKETLLRRVTFDLTGLPPTPEQRRRFLKDSSPDAYARLVDELLASPRYGERWGRYWLDVVRYADSSGFEGDHYFPNAWRYRDYVIASFNEDKPYNEFVQEQIAADEIWPNELVNEGSYLISAQKQKDFQRRIGTGMYTVGPYDPTSRLNDEQFRYERLTDMADTTGAAFLGLTVGCARCHDHKFDPISQKDYYRLQAIFAGTAEVVLPAVGMRPIADYLKAAPVRLRLEEKRRQIQRFDAKVKSRDKSKKLISDLLTPAERVERDAMLMELAELTLAAPPHYPTATVLGHAERVPDVHIAIRGDFRNKGPKVRPGFPSALSDRGDLEEPPAPFVPQRRKALAEFLTQPDHPLTARVMVNRIWQGHFGRGIVASANDFGRQGDAPTHPELLDWLATEFVARGWSIKAMHRLILLSETYQLSNEFSEANAKIDPDNRYLWRMPRRRLDAESIRDAILLSAGSLNTKMGGPPVIPPLAAEELASLPDPEQWPRTLESGEVLRRSVYLLNKRTFRLPMMETFDQPDNTISCARRDTSNVAPQALALLNNDFVVEQASAFAASLKSTGETPAALVKEGWLRALGRVPTPAETQESLRLFRKNDDAERLQFCLMLLNLNEFIYVD